MKTTRELIDFLRKTADNLEERLGWEEITDELYYQASTFGIEVPFLTTYDGLIDFNNPSKGKEVE